MTECGTDSPVEHVLSQEDAVWIHFVLTYFYNFNSIKIGVVHVSCYAFVSTNVHLNFIPGQLLGMLHLPFGL